MTDVVDTILKHEGGYQNHPNDHANFVGNRMVGTKYGITPKVLAKHRGVPVRTLSAKDMMKLEKDEARAIYEQQYVTPFAGIQDEKLRNNVIDMGVNAGPARAAKILQETLGVKADGKIGPKTLKALKDSGLTTDDYADARLGYYNRIAAENPKLQSFIGGWTNRANSFRTN